MTKMTFTIGEVATLLGITPKTIKHYHDIGLLPEPQRDSNQYRLYSMSDIQQLQQILRLKQFGLSLKQIDIIIKSSDPDTVAKTVLSQHRNNIHDKIAKLQHQLNETETVLNTDRPITQLNQTSQSEVSSAVVLSDTLKRQNSGLSDLLIEIEHDALSQLDRFEWESSYEFFWYCAGRRFIEEVSDERLLVFWLERYLALKTMAPDDLQAQSWLNELKYTAERRILANALALPMFTHLPQEDQQQIARLLPSLLHEEGSLLQKQFLALLFGS